MKKGVLIMISYGARSGQPAYRLDTLYLDTPEDLHDLTADHAVGSKAQVISTSIWYKLNSRGEWVQQTIGGGGGGVGIASIEVDDNNHVIVTYTDGTVQDAGQIKVDTSGESPIIHI